MKRLFTNFLVLIILIFIGCRQEPIHYFSELFPEDGLFIRPDSLSDGIWIAFCKTNKNQIGLKLHYKNGNRNGESISFWPNGKIQQRGYYKDGCLVGKNERWYKNGIKESERLCESEDYKKHFFHCNEIVNYWSKDGTQLIKDGSGKYLSYHDNDTLQVMGRYLNGLRTGQWNWYYDNGALQSVQHFIQGKENGEFVSYYRNGQIRSKGLYYNGKRMGKWEDWYQDGKNEQHETRVDGLRDGEYRYWHSNGQLSQLGYYKLGIEEGIWKHWDEEGKLEIEEKYSDGKIIEQKHFNTE